MKKHSSVGMVILAFVIAFGVVPVCRAQAQADAVQQTPAEITRRMQELEKLVTDLRSEVAELKKSGSNAGGASALSNVAAAAPAAAVAAPTAAPSVASLLGPTTLSGFVDMYYGGNFNHPALRNNTLRSFDVNANQFGLNLVELVVDKAPDAAASRTGYHIALGYGQAINAVNGSDPGGLGFDQYLKEAYFSYLAPVGKGLQVDAGKFVTPHGNEVIETKDNWNYSRGLLFSYAIPYYHFGLRAKYTFNDKYSLTGYLVNGWNNVVDNNSGKTYGVSLGWNPTKKISLTQNYMAGPEGTVNNSDWRQLWDTVVTVTPTPKLAFAANYDYGRGDRSLGIVEPVYWSGIAGLVRYAPNAKYAFATRYEYYNDHDGFTTGTAQHLNGITGTLQRTFASQILARLEFRRDLSNRPVFTQGSTPVTGQNTLTAGFVYTFDSREAK